MSALRKINWQERFDRPLRIKGRRASLKTREEAGAFILDELPSHRQHRTTWKAAMAALVSGAPIDRARDLIEKALASDGVLGK